MSIAKALIPNKEWIVEDHGKKIGTLSKTKGGYIFFKGNLAINFSNFNEAKEDLDFEVETKNKTKTKSWTLG